VTIVQGTVLAGASAAAGLINAVAGGGTLLSFPTLIAVGVPPVQANATNTVALWPGQVSSAWAYRTTLYGERRMAVSLGIPSLLGGLIGSILLLQLPAKVFEAVVPWLIVFACVVIALQTQIRRVLAKVPAASHPAALWLAQLLIAVYGGYFGAGIGILMLAAMGIMLPGSIQTANALKVLFALLINGIAAAYFVVVRAVYPWEALLMMVASMVGGYVGAHVAQRLPASAMRAVAIAVGLFAAGKLLLR
jgi:uncharacterized membrane protein YfcA